MKNTIATLLLATSLSAFTTATETPGKRIQTPRELGLEIIHALSRSSEEQFLSLLPSVSDFHAIMSDNARIYGGNLTEAQSDFSRNYAGTLVPSARRSFEMLLEEGKKQQIDWNSIQVTAITGETVPQGSLSFVTVSIDFVSAGNPHTLKIEKSLVWNGQWKVSQYVSLQ